jgi:hypothetical protein
MQTAVYPDQGPNPKASNDVPRAPELQSPSGLEVNHQSHHSELEPNGQAAVYPDQGPEFYDPKASNDAPPEPRVHVMSRRMFWISVAAVVIIIAALGGGLGARFSTDSLSTNNHKNTTVSPQMTGASSMTTLSTALSSMATSSMATSSTHPSGYMITHIVYKSDGFKVKVTWKDGVPYTDIESDGYILTIN